MSQKNISYYKKDTYRKTVLVWDSNDQPYKGSSDITVLWKGRYKNCDPDMVPILSYVDEHAESLRKRYLAWVYELGEIRINGKRIVDHLEIRDGFSYWWMTLLVEKSNFAKSPQISDVIRLMAFDDWAIDCEIRKVILASNNRLLAKCMHLWCNKFEISFKWQRLPSKRKNKTLLRRIFQFLPSTLKALIWLLRYLKIRWPLKGVGLREWQHTKGHLTFVSYMDNLLPATAEIGKFESRYWSSLNDMLQNKRCESNWLHLFAKDRYLTNTTKAAQIIKDFNKNSEDEQVHVSLDTFLTLKTIYKALKDFFKIRDVNKIFKKRAITLNSDFIFWPLLKKDWQDSLNGVTAMHNVLYLNLFECAMQTLPIQTKGVYLQEKQAWESCFLNTWKSAGHGQIIGYIHSTIRFWDLRHFFDERIYYNKKTNNSMPLPDKVAVNGQVAKKYYSLGGYPPDDLVEVEALRYLYLREFCTKQKQNNKSLPSSIRLLVLGDYSSENTKRQMELVKYAVSYLSVKTFTTVKPHPNCFIKSEDYSMVPIDVKMEPVSKLLKESDLAYTSMRTSAAVDAYCAGLPVISFLDSDDLNMSPLLGQKDVSFVSTSEELSNSISSVLSGQLVGAKNLNFFYLNNRLELWKKLLLVH